MTKAVKENIKKNVELLKWNLKLSNEQFEKIYGVKKEEGVANILDAILRDLANNFLQGHANENNGKRKGS